MAHRLTASVLGVYGEPAGLGPVFAAKLGDEDLDLLGAQVIRVHERVGDPGHQAALGAATPP